MKMVMRLLTLSVVIGLALFLGFYLQNHMGGVLNPKGVISIAEKNLMITAILLMLIPVVPIFIMLAAFTWRYRASNTKAKYSPEWHSNKLIEAVWWTIPAIIIFILAVITWNSTHALDPYRPLDSNVAPITIEVVALDWKWLFIYPDEHIATVNYVEFPKDVPVTFKITSDAPMNAFWIPELAGQVYAMQGMTAQLHVMANEEGDYKGLSSNFSGDGFEGMRFTAHVASQDSYDAWLQQVRSASSSLTYDEYENTLSKPSKNNPPTYYSSVDSNLYTKIIAKFMPYMDMPESEATDTVIVPPRQDNGMEDMEMPGLEGSNVN